MEVKKYWAIKDGYLVNRDGSIYALNWRNTKTMRKVLCRKRDDGYLDCKIHGKVWLVHRFVAEAFIPNPNNCEMVNHKDETRDNNCVDNLEWCSRKYNLNYGTAQKRHSEKVCGENNPFYNKHHTEKSRKLMSEAKKWFVPWNKGTKGLQVAWNKDKGKTVYQYTKDGEFVKQWGSCGEIQRTLGYDISTISKCCNGKLKLAYDYRWSFAPLD